MKRQSSALLAAGVLVTSCAAIGCGGGSKSISTARSAAVGTTSGTGAATATYRKTLEQAVATAGADKSGFDNCTFNFNTQLCRQWADTDQDQGRRILRSLAGARVPPGEASAARSLLRFMRHVIALDVALRKAVDTDKANSAAVQVVTAKIGDEPNEVNSLLNKMDPGLAFPVRGQPNG